MATKKTAVKKAAKKSAGKGQRKAPAKKQAVSQGKGTKVKQTQKESPVQPIEITSAELTAKQELFCREYLIDLNATQAAIRAGYSKETAYSIGGENLKKPEVQKRISSLMQERLQKLDITQEMVVRELAAIAFANIKEFLHLDEKGNTMFRDFDEVSSDSTKVISEVVVMYTPTGNKKTKMKMHDKMEALKLLGQHLGMFKIGIDATSGGKPFGTEYDLSKLTTDQLKVFMELTKILAQVK